MISLYSSKKKKNCLKNSNSNSVLKKKNPGWNETTWRGRDESNLAVGVTWHWWYLPDMALAQWVSSLSYILLLQPWPPQWVGLKGANMIKFLHKTRNRTEIQHFHFTCNSRKQHFGNWIVYSFPVEFSGRTDPIQQGSHTPCWHFPQSFQGHSGRVCNSVKDTTGWMCIRFDISQPKILSCRDHVS